MSFTLQLIIRLLAAALMGAVIGYEREIRAKGAGIRTHVLVALGSALFMIVSQNGFAGAPRFDAARVAAGVVSGIGFLGGGIIIKSQKNHITGLTTAAGLWVTAAMGLSVGSGMYEVAAVCAVLVIVCLEALHFYTIKHGEKELDVVFSSSDMESLAKVVKDLDKQVVRYTISKQPDSYILELTLSVSKREYLYDILPRLSVLDGVRLDKIE